MGDLYLDWLPDIVGGALEPLGYDWDIFDDQWLHRARSSGGYDEPPLCVMWHHTASGGNAWDDAAYQCYTADARPISNITIDGDVCLILAGGATNTNGSGTNSPLEFSRGWVANDDMNRCAVGVEICNDGVGQPYPEPMLDALFAISNAINRRCGNQPTDVCTHQHYAPERKVDPATAAACQGRWQPTWSTSSGSWDVEDLRAECEARANGGGNDMPLSDDDIAKIAKAVWDETIQGDQPDEAKPARWRLRQIQGMCRHYLGGWKESQPAPEQSLLKRIDENTS